MGLPYSEEIGIVGRTMWAESTSVTDRLTMTKTGLCIESRGKNAATFSSITTLEMWTDLYRVTLRTARS